MKLQTLITGTIVAIFSRNRLLAQADNTDTFAPLSASDIDFSKYLGTWRQVYSDLPSTFTQLGGVCATQVLSTAVADPLVIEVTNSVYPIPLVDLPIEIEGYGVQDPFGTASLAVNFGFIPYIWGLFGFLNAAEATFVAPGNYWIIEVGPEKNGFYDWAIVANEAKSTLFILTRNVQRFDELYQESVLLKVQAYGFITFFNKPVRTYTQRCETLSDPTEPWF